MPNSSIVNSSGRNSPVGPLTLNLDVRRFGGLSNNLSVTVSSANIADNVVLSDLAFDLTREIKLAIQSGAIPGLSVVNGISPIEVQSSPNGQLRLVANDKSINGLTVAAVLPTSSDFPPVKRAAITISKFFSATAITSALISTSRKPW